MRRSRNSRLSGKQGASLPPRSGQSARSRRSFTKSFWRAPFKMPYSYKSLAFAWLVTFSLFAMSASGAAHGWGFVVLLAVAVAVPALVLRRPMAVAAASAERLLVVADEPDRLPSDLGAIDVLRWENEGGAPRQSSWTMSRDRSPRIRQDTQFCSCAQTHRHTTAIAAH